MKECEKIHEEKLENPGARVAEYLQWCDVRNHIEVYNADHEHIGTIDPEIRKYYKPSIKGKKINLLE